MLPLAKGVGPRATVMRGAAATVAAGCLIAALPIAAHHLLARHAALIGVAARARGACRCRARCMGGVAGAAPVGVGAVDGMDRRR